MALYAQISKNKEKIRQGIVAIEWQPNQDIPEKDREIFRQTLEAYKCALSGSQNMKKEIIIQAGYNPAFFPCAGALCPGSIPGGTVPQAFICRFKAFVPSNGQEVRHKLLEYHTGQNSKRKRHKKSLHIDNYIMWCYALSNYKAVKGF